MDNPIWLRVITVGLVLAALAVGYFLLTGRFSSSKVVKPNTQVINQASPTPVATMIPTTNSGSNSVLGQNTETRTQATPPAMAAARNNVTTLPRTGFPIVLAGIISAGVMISGLGLRKFPH